MASSGAQQLASAIRDSCIHRSKWSSAATQSGISDVSLLAQRLQQADVRDNATRIVANNAEVKRELDNIKAVLEAAAVQRNIRDEVAVHSIPAEDITHPTVKSILTLVAKLPEDIPQVFELLRENNVYTELTDKTIKKHITRIAELKVESAHQVQQMEKTLEQYQALVQSNNEKHEDIEALRDDKSALTSKVATQKRQIEDLELQIQSVAATNKEDESSEKDDDDMDGVQREEDPEMITLREKCQTLERQVEEYKSRALQAEQDKPNQTRFDLLSRGVAEQGIPAVSEAYRQLNEKYYATIWRNSKLRDENRDLRKSEAKQAETINGLKAELYFKTTSLERQEGKRDKEDLFRHRDQTLFKMVADARAHVDRLRKDLVAESKFVDLGDDIVQQIRQIGEVNFSSDIPSLSGLFIWFGNFRQEHRRHADEIDASVTAFKEFKGLNSLFEKTAGLAKLLLRYRETDQSTVTSLENRLQEEKDKSATSIEIEKSHAADLLRTERENWASEKNTWLDQNKSLTNKLEELRKEKNKEALKFAVSKTGMESDNETLVESKDNAIEERDKARSDLDKEQKKSTALNDRVHELERDKSELETQKSSLQQDRSKAEQKVEELTEQLEESTENLGEARSSAAKSAGAEEALQQIREANQQTLKHERDQVKDLGEKLSAVESERNGLLITNSGLTSDKRSLTENVDRLKKAEEDGKNALQECRTKSETEKKTLTNELTLVKGNLSTTTEQLTRKSTDLTSALNSLTNTTEDKNETELAYLCLQRMLYGFMLTKGDWEAYKACFGHVAKICDAYQTLKTSSKIWNLHDEQKKVNDEFRYIESQPVSESPTVLLADLWYVLCHPNAELDQVKVSALIHNLPKVGYEGTFFMLAALQDGLSKKSPRTADELLAWLRLANLLWTMHPDSARRLGSHIIKFDINGLSSKRVLLRALYDVARMRFAGNKKSLKDALLDHPNEVLQVGDFLLVPDGSNLLFVRDGALLMNRDQFDLRAAELGFEFIVKGVDQAGEMAPNEELVLPVDASDALERLFQDLLDRTITRIGGKL